MRLKLITAPNEEPVSLEAARGHLRGPDASLNAQIVPLIAAARAHAEDTTGRALITQTWDLILDEFPDEIALPRPPLQEVTSVKYRDRDNVEQTLSPASYQVDDDDSGARIVRATNTSWPDTYDRIDAVTVRIKCGYGGAGKVPYQAQAAMLLHVEAHFDRDERMMEKLLAACDSLLWPLRVLKV